MYYENKREKQRKNFFVFLSMIIIIGLLFALNIRIDILKESNIQGEYIAEKLSIDNETLQNNQIEKVSKYEFIEKSSKAIVGISKLKQQGASIFSSNVQNVGIGSGVLITENGYILTNHHVAGNKYSNCYVTLENGESYDGNVVWADENIDLAIVKINVAKMDYLELGDSDTIKLGEDVYAIGNPIGFEFQRTVTKGIISGLNRTLRIEEDDKQSYLEDLIQTDCTINYGNSGGALISEKGELLGINTIKITDVEGMGFAVPINIVKPIIEKLVANGKFEEAYLGIYGYDKEVIPYLSSSENLESGIYVAQIQLDGPIYKSGILVGDIITKLDNIEINKMSELRKYIYSKKPGDKVKLIINRKNKNFEVEVELSYKL